MVKTILAHDFTGMDYILPDITNAIELLVNGISTEVHILIQGVTHNQEPASTVCFERAKQIVKVLNLGDFKIVDCPGDVDDDLSKIVISIK